MVVRLQIGVLSKGAFDHVRDTFSAQGPFTPLTGNQYVVDGLEFIYRPEDDSEQASLDWLKGGGQPVACLDDDYDHLEIGIDAGVRAIWLNREGGFAPEDVPAHDADILSVKDLLKNNDLFQKPSLQQCYAWWDEWDVPENIRRHVKTVAYGAYILAVMMRNRGIQVDPILTHRGGLMHDIDKIETLERAGQHGQMGAEFLLQQGYPIMAEIVREHIMHRILRPEAENLSWEVKLVYFIDKLVEGDRIIPFNERLTALKQRYPGYRGAMERAESHIWALSEKIESILSIPDHEKLIEALCKF